ncbi:hypothetical protein [Acidovorax sp.]|uniref:hypothetical protein n=1 Tax=Acidovorax sp. TaxID=1872122 RepID=UPI00391EFFBC
MSHLLFKWVLREDRYEFTGQAKTPRAAEGEVNAEILAIWAWLQRQKLRPAEYRWNATRRTTTSKDETLVVTGGAVVADGGTILHPQETRVVLSLPEKVAVQFRFEFNVVDDRS